MNARNFLIFSVVAMVINQKMILVFLLMCTCHPVKCWLADVCSAQIKSRIQNRGSRSIWIIVIIYFSLFFFIFYYSNIYLQVIYVIKMRNTIYVKVRDNTKPTNRCTEKKQLFMRALEKKLQLSFMGFVLISHPNLGS